MSSESSKGAATASGHPGTAPSPNHSLDDRPWTNRPSPASAPTPSSVGPSDEARIAGIDVARALAIFGMFAVHLHPAEADGPLRHVFTVPHGRASLLFMLVAGVGTSLLAGSTRRSIATVRWQLLWRSALLLPLGLALQQLDHGVAVILATYAVLFVTGTVLIAVPSRWLLRMVVIAVPVGTTLFLRGAVNSPETFTRSPVGLTDSLADVVHGLMLWGPYPVTTWLAPYVLGIWIGRTDLRSRQVRLRLVAWGAGVALAASASSDALTAWLGEPGEPIGWDRLVVDTPHSQMPLWVIGSTAVAVSVLGATLLASERAGRMIWPLVATGQLALTVYVGHLLALHWMTSAPIGPTTQSAVAVLSAFMVVGVVASVVWRMRFRRGPLELLIHAPWR